MQFATTDLCDAHPDTVRVLTPMFQNYGKHAQFSGPAATLKVFEDNSLVREILETPGEGRVLVIDGGGSQRCALVGGQLGVLAEKNGWAGIVVYGCIRDTLELNACAIGLRALGPHPMKSVKKGVSDRNVPVTFGGTTIHPGEYVYADEDGVLVSAQALA